ncbi:MAG TPA: sugar transferase [Hymenobacter sp.]|uniref:sugar transferase n=1 Tax=Hymenobacter sp. TaxID=1898978 RepID=UPI002D80AF06|nr:sugar transferase [Hymenobacter sp.]HET9504713.1 sugar transferase [Hymenobacter sp.]
MELTDARPVVRTPQSKRLFDMVFALLVAVALLSWLIPIIAVLIKLESRGPVFFKQLRTGKDGKSFYCFKFRSMRVNADSETKQARRGDARITRVGAYLRKSSLDELPQFINVLLGEMSIVGPRPHMLAHTEEYSQVIHNFMDRHRGMPGITGLAQVSGHRGETRELSAMAKRVNADIYYLQNQTFWLDVKIVLLTVRQALSKNEHVF